MTKMYRQGDVLLKKVDKLPKGAKLRKGNNNVLVEGEVTGHAHRLENGLIYETEGRYWSEPKEMFIEAKRKTVLVHEEHGPIEIEIGFYIILRQREYNGKENRLVQD